MDDLYNNAWGDTSDFYAGTQSHASSSQKAWVSPNLTLASTTQHEEADLANPSWSTGADIKWNEPSDHEQSNGFTWSGTDPDLAWGSSTYEGISLSKPESPVTTDEVDPPATEEDVEVTDADTRSDTTETAPTVATTLDLPTFDDLRTHPPESLEVESPPSSPEQDGFGTFEDAAAFEDTSLSPEVSTGLQEEPWGSPWASGPAAEEEEGPQPVDEWEVARRNKERQDKLVPPELLASIISQCEEYFEAVASKASSTNKDDATAEQKPETDTESKAKEEETSKPLREEPWMSDWRSGIEGIEGLETLMQSLVPELTLQPGPSFTKTGIAKNMASTVRVTKNLPLSKASPMSHYMAARGSTAWETAIKQSKDTVEEDVVPVGWRIVEKQTRQEADSPSSSRTSSGFFSFWSKRQSKTPASVTSPKEMSPSRGSISSMPTGDTGTPSPRMSIDSSHSRAVSNDKSRQPSPAPSSASTPIPPEPSKTPSIDPAPTPSPTHSTSSYADAPDLMADAEAQIPQHQPPSAVSRFLNRFSRRSSLGGPSSPRSSLALSTDDLEFLGDIVPNATEGAEDNEPDLKGLNSILKAESLPPVLPLPPPPRPASVAKLPSQLINAGASVSSALIDTAAVSPQPPSARTDQHDLEDVFGDFETSPTSATASGTDHTAALMPAAASITRPQTRPQTPVISVTHTRTASPSPFSFASTLVPTRSESQPSILPPPASTPIPSVSVTSAIAPPPIQRAETEPSFDFDEMARREQLRPIVPLSFNLPSPSEPISPGLPSASEVPLAQLYPEAAARQHAKQASLSSSSSVPKKSSIPSFPPPPSQPSRSHTPIMVKAPRNTNVVAPLLAPPPGSARPATAVSVNLLGGDDDDDFGDFSDFQSSAPSTASVSAPQKPAFAFPPPPPSATTKPATLAPLLPPPSYGSPLVNSPSTPQPLSSDSLHTDFGTRLLSTSASLDSHRSHVSGLNISFQSDQSLLTPHKEASGFDFMSSTSTALRTPSPPRPLSKAPRPALSLEPPKVPHPPTILSPAEKVTQHQRTLSLMERAAARPGQWPAPPSPLPQAISFPGPASAASVQSVDLLGDDDFGAFESDAPALAPPPASSVQKAAEPVKPAQLWSSFAPVVPEIQEPPKPNGRGASKASGGGLSAQDLSFFEGL